MARSLVDGLAQYNFFGKMFVTVFFVKIFNFIAHANNTMCNIALHNDFRESFNDALNINEDA